MHNVIAVSVLVVFSFRSFHDYLYFAVLAGANVNLFAFDLSKTETHGNVPHGLDAVFVIPPGTADRTALGIAGINAAKSAMVRSSVSLRHCFYNSSVAHC